MEKKDKIIIGSAVGGVVFLAAIFYFLFFYRANECPAGTELQECKLGPCCCPVGAICD